MKIISKFKDFYDYLAQDYDADIIYVRNAEYKDDIGRLQYLYKSPTIWFDRDESKIIEFPETDSYVLGELKLRMVIFGIYPFVYSVPVLSIYGRDDYYGTDKALYEFLSRSFLDSLKGLNEKKVYAMFNDFAIDCVKKFNKKNKNTFPFHPYEEGIEYKLLNVRVIDGKKESIFEYITNRCKKLECTEIFNILKAPVFIEENKVLDFYHAGFSLERSEEYKKSHRFYNQYVINPSLITINPQIIKYWYDDLVNINTYNDIESFLWSIKQEPISEPTNKQKIINHGFDLKTSFRKM